MIPVSIDQVEDKIVEVLKKWMESEIFLITSSRGLDMLALPLSYNVRPENDKFTEDHLPAVIVASLGTEGPPRKDGSGTYEANWKVSVVVVVNGNSRESTNRNARIYAAAVRAILVERRGLDGMSTGGRWDGESYDEGPAEMGRTLAATTIDFTFTIPNVAGRLDRLAEPIAPPGPIPDGVTVQDTEMTTLLRGIEE